MDIVRLALAVAKDKWPDQKYLLTITLVGSERVVGTFVSYADGVLCLEQSKEIPCILINDAYIMTVRPSIDCRE